MAIELTPAERKVLYNRFSAMKHRAKELGVPFHWEHKNGFSDFLLSLEDVAPEDFSPDKYWVRFHKETVARENLYGPAALRVKSVKDRAARQRRGLEEESLQNRKKKVLLTQWELRKLLEVSAHLGQVLTELEGSPDDLMKEALYRANAKDLFPQ